MTDKIAAESEHQTSTLRKNSGIKQPHFSAPLKVAIEIGDLRLCKRIVDDQVDLNVSLPGCDTCTPLIYSLIHIQEQIANYFVSQNASLDVVACPETRYHGWNPFHFVTTYGWDKLLVLMLEKYPQGLRRGDSPVHPIHLAVIDGHKACLDVILEYAGNMPSLSSDSSLLVTFYSRRKRERPSEPTDWPPKYWLGVVKYPKISFLRQSVTSGRTLPNCFNGRGFIE